MSIPTEFFRWWITDEITGRRRLTSFRMTREQALERYPGAEPDEGTKELREVLLPGEQPSPHRR